MNKERIKKLIDMNKVKIEEIEIHIGILELRKSKETEKENIAKLDTAIEAKKHEIVTVKNFSTELEELL